MFWSTWHKCNFLRPSVCVEWTPAATLYVQTRSSQKNSWDDTLRSLWLINGWTLLIEYKHTHTWLTFFHDSPFGFVFVSWWSRRRLKLISPVVQEGLRHAGRAEAWNQSRQETEKLWARDQEMQFLDPKFRQSFFSLDYICSLFWSNSIEPGTVIWGNMGSELHLCCVNPFNLFVWNQ